jgi:hypothetical protein
MFKGKKVNTNNYSDSKNFVLILHQLDRSGAVLVALDIYANLMKHFYGSKLILTPTINDDSLLSEVEKWVTA